MCKETKAALRRSNSKRKEVKLEEVHSTHFRQAERAGRRSFSLSALPSQSSPPNTPKDRGFTTRVVQASSPSFYPVRPCGGFFEGSRTSLALVWLIHVAPMIENFPEEHKARYCGRSKQAATIYSRGSGEQCVLRCCFLFL